MFSFAAPASNTLTPVLSVTQSRCNNQGLKDHVNDLPGDLLVKLFRSFVTYSGLYESFFVMLHDEIVTRATVLGAEELELLKQPLLVKKDLFFDSPLKVLLKMNK